MACVLELQDVEVNIPQKIFDDLPASLPASCQRALSLVILAAAGALRRRAREISHLQLGQKVPSPEPVN